jgi:hypothetical protein
VRSLLPPVRLHGYEPVVGAVPALGADDAAVRAEFTPDETVGDEAEKP